MANTGVNISTIAVHYKAKGAKELTEYIIPVTAICEQFATIVSNKKLTILWYKVEDSGGSRFVVDNDQFKAMIKYGIELAKTSKALVVWEHTEVSLLGICFLSCKANSCNQCYYRTTLKALRTLM